MAFWSSIVVILFCVIVRGRTAPAEDNSEIYLRLPAIQEEEYHEISPELLDVYKDLELLNKLEKGNVTERREGRGFLTKLYFLTGLKLGSLLTSSGTLAASNSIRILGKVFNSALSVSYGSAYEDIEPLPEVDEPGSDESVVDTPELGSSELPQALVPTIPVVEVEPKLQNSEEVPNTNILSTTVDSKKMFLEQHNKRVASLNRFMEGKHRTPRFKNITRLPIINEEDYLGITPELLQVYNDVQLLHKLDDFNVSYSRVNRQLLNKLNFLTGLKLGGLLLSGSGSFATSQNFNLFGKVVSYALSAAYSDETGQIETPEVEPSCCTKPIIQNSDAERLNTESNYIKKLRNKLIQEHNKRIAELNKKQNTK